MLLGLFFMSVGMSIDGGVVRAHWLWLVAATLATVAVKAAIVAVLLRIFGSPRSDAVRGGALLATAGEFAFVVLPLAGSLGLLTGPAAQFVTALAALTMLVAPMAAKALDLALARRRAGLPEPEPDDFAGAGGSVLVVGFGRFGQVVDQVLLAAGNSVTVIDKNVDRIRAAARFGFRVFYGDGTRLDVLRAAGIGRARIVCVCVDDREAALKIVDIVQEEFPQVRTFVRAYDRIHAIDLMKLQVDYQLRETFESALRFGRATLEELGVQEEEAAAITSDVRRRDIARLVMQQIGRHHGRRRSPPRHAPRAGAAQRPDGKAARPLARNPRHHRRGRARRCLTKAGRHAHRRPRTARFVSGPTMRHVVVMTAHGLGRARRRVRRRPPVAALHLLARQAGADRRRRACDDRPVLRRLDQCRADDRRRRARVAGARRRRVRQRAPARGLRLRARGACRRGGHARAPAAACRRS